ncbi:hypothetical protein Tco_0206974 [Tanacetum coccineum]
MISVVSILEGFTNEPPLKENADLFDLEYKMNEWNKILYDDPIDDLIFDPRGDIDEIDAFLDIDISTNIKDDFYYPEGDVLYLESLLSDDTTPSPPPEVFLDPDPRSLRDINDLKIMVKCCGEIPDGSLPLSRLTKRCGSRLKGGGKNNKNCNHVCKLDKAFIDLNKLQEHDSVQRYLKGTPNLGLWDPKCLGFDLKGYSNSDYAGCNIDKKSTSGNGYQEKDKIKIKPDKTRHGIGKSAKNPKSKAYPSSNGPPQAHLMGRRRGGQSRVKIIGFMAVWIEGTRLEDGGAYQALDPSAHGYK